MALQASGAASSSVPSRHQVRLPASPLLRDPLCRECGRVSVRQHNAPDTPPIIRAAINAPIAPSVTSAPRSPAHPPVLPQARIHWVRLADPGPGRARRGQVPAGTRHGLRVQGTGLWLISSPVKHDLLDSSYLWRAQEYDRLGHTLALYELEHCERWASVTVLGVGEGEHGRRQGPGKKKMGGCPGMGSKSKSLFCGAFNLFSR
ncbi:hypothetical protein Zm00014a_025901 [Zea mays]|uniref:Uncharacterized protein n=1 Tax=Zea mays TaxID=4577 RepID=A0A317Y2E2_MAIZE|nr:hypothetical protein Zm00014a_025901 [Zea mays]